VSTGRPIVVSAAGGILIRGDDPGEIEVAVVHRPRYDDWTLPKGKQDPGETIEMTATREVVEETGFAARVIGHAATNRYRIDGGDKQVEYFWMRPYRFDGFQPNNEVDQVVWLPIETARAALTYQFDRRMLSNGNLAGPVRHTTLHIVRHAAAGDRTKWEGDDAERPLTEKGERQARAIADALEGVGITRILSSYYLRCRQTVAPLAERIGRKVEHHDALREGASPRLIAELLDEVAGSTVVLCSHGDVIPEMLRRLQWMGVRFLSPAACQKASTWVVSHDGEEYREAFYVEPPVSDGA